MRTVLSTCGTYRYSLTRKISQPVRWIKWGCFVMLNPSTADASNDDPTIRRCMGFAKRFGWTDLVVLNLFALRATDPRELRKHHDPIGPANDATIAALPENIPVIAAWGAHPMAKKRAREVIPLLRRPVHCLATTKSGEPRHPLYLSNACEPIIWHNSTEYGALPITEATP